MDLDMKRVEYHWHRLQKTLISLAYEPSSNICSTTHLSKIGDKKGFTYEELCENTENVLKETPQKTYQNLIWGCYFKPYKSN